MTLQELHDYIESKAKSRKAVNQFRTGSAYNADEKRHDEFPLVFYEMPYFITYNFRPEVQGDRVQFAFCVYNRTKKDDPEGDHIVISDMKEVGDSICTRIICDNEADFLIEGITAVSVRQYGEHSVAGMRYEWQVVLPRTYCESTNWNLLFDDE